MSLANETDAPVRNADRFYIGGEWVQPSSDAKIDVIDSGTEQLFFIVAEAQAADISRAVAAARQAFDEGSWPRLSHAQRAEYLRAMAGGLRERAAELGRIWPRESGVLYKIAQYAGPGAAGTFDFYAGLADTFPFEKQRSRPPAASSASSSGSQLALSGRSSRGTRR